MVNWGKFRFFALLIALWALHAPAQSLERLEAILSHYSSLEAFLADTKGLADYREAYRIFLGDSDIANSADSFDQVWEKFLGQLREANEKVPGFGAQVWQVNEKWRESEFQLKGEAKGSGLVGKREPLLAEMEKLFQEVVEETKPVMDKELEGVREAQRLVNELKDKYGVRSPEELKLLSRAEAKAYAIRIGGDKKKHQLGLADDPSAKILAAYLVRRLLGGDEGLRDFLLSGDPDMTHDGLERLRRLESFAEVFKRWNLREVNEILPYLKFSSARLDTLESDYWRGLESMQAFRHIKDARPSADLLPRLQELNGQGVRGDKVRANLSEPLRKTYDEWSQAAADVSALKRQVASKYQSPFFHYTLVEDPIRKTTRLQSDAPLALTYVASPRPFHLLLAGRKNRECVGGGQCQNLVVKRWARAALNGDRSLFSLNSDRTMEGFIGLTQVKSEKNLNPTWVLDLGSRATKGEIVFRNTEGRLVKYTFFDALIDRLSQTPGANPKPRFIISDGNTVSANVAGSDLLPRSQAYNEKRIVGTPGDFTPMDPMAAKIAEMFPQTLHEYGGGGLIFDGMKNDGTNVFELVPRSDRRRWSKEELERKLYARAGYGRPFEDWILVKAFEAGVRLGPESQYRDMNRAHEFYTGYVSKLSQELKRGSKNMEVDPILDVVTELNGLHFPTKDSAPHPLQNSELVDLLVQKAIDEPGSEAATKILSSVVLLRANPGKVIEAALQNIKHEQPSVRNAAAFALHTVAGRKEGYPRFLEADVLSAISSLLKTPQDPSPDYDGHVHAANALRTAMEAKPQDAVLHSDAMLKMVSEVLKAAKDDVPTQRLELREVLFWIFAQALQNNSGLAIPVSDENTAAFESLFISKQRHGQDLRVLTRYLEAAMAADSVSTLLSTSPALALLDHDRLARAVEKNPTEPRLQTSVVWDHFLRILAPHKAPHPGISVANSETVPVFQALTAVAKAFPGSSAFTHPGLVAEIRATNSRMAFPLIAHLIRQGSVADLTPERVNRSFGDDNRRAEVRAYMETHPQSPMVTEAVTRLVTRSLSGDGDYSEFLKWLLSGPPLAAAVQHAIVKGINRAATTHLLAKHLSDPPPKDIRKSIDFEDLLWRNLREAILREPGGPATGIAAELTGGADPLTLLEDLKVAFQKSERLAPEDLKKLTQRLGSYATSKTHPATRKKGSEALLELAKSQFSDFLRYATPEIKLWLSEAGNRAAILDVITHRKQAKELVRLVRADRSPPRILGIPLVNPISVQTTIRRDLLNAVAAKAQESLPPEILNIGNSRKARRALAARPVAAEGCSRHLQQLYLKYLRPGRGH